MILKTFFKFALSMTLFDSVVAGESTRWHQLNQLVTAEIKTILSVRKLPIGLKFRLFSLYSEQIGIIRNQENREFLKSNSKKRKKKYYFKKSNKKYLKTLNYGKKLIKQNPRYENIPEIYYILALNSRDYAKGNITEKYLLKALKSRMVTDSKKHLINVALAEYFYNEKEYKTAIHYYSYVLQNNHDEWKAKHMLNAGWCYFKQRNYHKAISLLKKAFGLNKKVYVSVSDQILSHIGTFFVYGGKAKEGYNFYISNSKDPSKHIIKMAHQTSEKGQFVETNFLLDQAISWAIKKQNIVAQIDLYSSQLDIFRQMGRHNLFFIAAQKLVNTHHNHPIDANRRIAIIEKIKGFVGFLQIQLKGSNLRTLEKQKKIKKVVAYFNFLTSLDPVNEDRYQYFIGELFYVIKNFNEVVNYYKLALNAFI